MVVTQVRGQVRATATPLPRHASIFRPDTEIVVVRLTDIIRSVVHAVDRNGAIVTTQTEEALVIGRTIGRKPL
ncbi:MAG: hypothetical protein A2005_01675 [Desulfuromonadales bacterium GWC2_61_20]|nr:MAG: hypothetical protein A2005_01675 [Desulfuromonadales bacterium GWC2_61_20]